MERLKTLTLSWFLTLLSFTAEAQESIASILQEKGYFKTEIDDNLFKRMAKIDPSRDAATQTKMTMWKTIMIVNNVQSWDVQEGQIGVTNGKSCATIELYKSEEGEFVKWTIIDNWEERKMELEDTQVAIDRLMKELPEVEWEARRI